MKAQLLSKGECHEYQWKAAKVAILNRLVAWPKAQMLAAEICDFYGDYLQYYESSALDSSHYQIKLQHEPIALQCAHRTSARHTADGRGINARTSSPVVFGCVAIL